jgi:hypothetical protein
MNKHKRLRVNGKGHGVAYSFKQPLENRIAMMRRWLQ